MNGYAYESKTYHCAECGTLLGHEHLRTEFGKRTLLAHGVFSGCKFSGRFFYLPKIELTEFPPEGLRSNV